jgi:hypothetical protein
MNKVRISSTEDYVRIHDEETDVVTSVCLETGKIHIGHFYDQSIAIKTKDISWGGDDGTDIEVNGERLISISNALHRGALK